MELQMMLCWAPLSLSDLTNPILSRSDLYIQATQWTMPGPVWLIADGGSGASYKLMRTFFSSFQITCMGFWTLQIFFRITIFIEVITNHWASRHSEQFIMTGLTHLYSWTFRSILICFVGKTFWSWHALVQCAQYSFTTIVSFYYYKAAIRIRVRCHVPFYYLNPIVLSHSSSDPRLRRTESNFANSMWSEVEDNDAAIITETEISFLIHLNIDHRT